MIDVDILRRSVELIVTRHGSLRTVFSVTDDECVQASAADTTVGNSNRVNPNGDISDVSGTTGIPFTTHVVGTGQAMSGQVIHVDTNSHATATQPPSPGSAVRCYQHELNADQVGWFELCDLSEVEAAQDALLASDEAAPRKVESSTDDQVKSSRQDLVSDDDVIEAFRRGSLRNLDVSKGPCFRCRVGVVTSDRTLLSIEAHHAVADGATWGIVLGELSEMCVVLPCCMPF